MQRDTLFHGVILADPGLTVTDRRELRQGRSVLEEAKRQRQVFIDVLGVLPALHFVADD